MSGWAVSWSVLWIACSSIFRNNGISVGRRWKMERLLCKVQGSRYKVCGGGVYGGRIENTYMEMMTPDLES